jgi:hypothetical protein
MKAARYQAKDVDEAAVIAAIQRLRTTPYPYSGVVPQDKRWVHFDELHDAFPDVPKKVFRAKLAAMIRKDILDGCTCGCRGDFEIRD